MSYSGFGQFSFMPFSTSVSVSADPNAWRPLVKAAATDVANAISRIPASERLLSTRKDKWASLQTRLITDVAAKATKPTETVDRIRLLLGLGGGIPAGIPPVGTLSVNASPRQITLQAERVTAAPFIAAVQSKFAALMVLLNPAQAAIDAAAARTKADADLQATRAAQQKAASDLQTARDQQAAADAMTRLAAANEATRLAAADKAAADQQAAQAAVAAALPVHVGPMPDGKLPPTTPYTTTPPRIEAETEAEPTDTRLVLPCPNGSTGRQADGTCGPVASWAPSIGPGPGVTGPGPGVTVGPLAPTASPGPLGVSWMVWGIGAAAVVGGYFMMGKKTTPNRRRVRRNRRRR